MPDDGEVEAILEDWSERRAAGERIHPEDVIRACEACADLAPDPHPTHIEYSLDELAPLTESAPSALCAFDLAFHDLLGLAAGMPL